VKRTCIQCGKRFDAQTKLQRLCGYECRRKRARQYHEAYMRHDVVAITKLLGRKPRWLTPQ